MKKIKFGIIGSGKIVRSFLEAASNTENFVFHGFYSRSKKIAEEFQKEYNVTYIYTDLEEMFKNDEIDAVYIAVPNFLHYKYTMLALENNKHVLIEKPFSSNNIEAVEMVNLAKKKKLLLMEAMRVTMLPNFNQIKKNLYKIGKVRRYTSSFCQYSSRYDAFLKGEILNTFNPELSNGALMDIGVYCIAPMINLFGMPKNIVAVGTKLHNGVDGQGQASFDYGDMEGHIEYSKISTSYLPTEIQGEKGTIIIDKMSYFGKVEIRYNNGTIEDIGVFQEVNDMIYEINEFIYLINHNKIDSLKNKLDNSLNVMNILDQIRAKLGIIYPADLKKKLNKK